MGQHPVYRFDDFLADPETWRLSRGGQEIHLEPVVLKLLIYLISNRERLVTRQELMDNGMGRHGDQRICAHQGRGPVA